MRQIRRNRRDKIDLVLMRRAEHDDGEPSFAFISSTIFRESVHIRRIHLGGQTPDAAYMLHLISQRSRFDTGQLCPQRFVLAGELLQLA